MRQLEFVALQAAVTVLAERIVELGLLMADLSPDRDTFVEEVAEESSRIMEELLRPENSPAVKTVIAGLVFSSLCRGVAAVSNETELFKPMPLEKALIEPPQEAADNEACIA